MDCIHGIPHDKSCRFCAAEKADEPVDKPTTGDVWDEDSGEYLGTIDLTEEGKQVLPAQLSVWFEGYFYIFKPQSKYKDESNSQENS